MSATKGSGKVQAVLPKTKKNGDPFWNIIIDGVEYYDSKGNFKDKNDQEVEFEWSASDDGKLKFINLPGQGGKWGGGGSKTSPEALAAQRRSFAVSYAKDIVVAIIGSTMTPETAKSFADTKDMKWGDMAEHMRAQSTELVKRTAEELSKLLTSLE
jgi:hypothetical protein